MGEQTTHLDLYFPEWQGYGMNNAVLNGASSIRNLLSPRKRFVEVGVPTEEGLEIEHDVLGYSSIIRSLKEARRIIEQADPRSIFLIGGTCASELAPVSYLNHVHRGDLVVLWFDAHGDLNTPASSPSKRFHGMPLRALMGEGPTEVLSLCFSRLSPAQVVLVGSRDLDEAEEAYVSANGMKVIPPSELRTTERLVEAVHKLGYTNSYLHVDLDVLEPTDFPHLLIPTPDGISYSEMLNAIHAVRSNTTIVGASIVEYVPVNSGAPQKIERLVDALNPDQPSRTRHPAPERA